MGYTFQTMYSIIFLIVFSVALHPPSIDVNKGNKTNHMTQNNNVIKSKILHYFYILIYILILILVILLVYVFFYKHCKNRWVRWNATRTLQRAIRNEVIYDEELPKTYRFSQANRVDSNFNHTEERRRKRKRLSKCRNKLEDDSSEERERDKYMTDMRRIGFSNVCALDVSNESIDKSVIPRATYVNLDFMSAPAKKFKRDSSSSSSNGSISIKVVKITHKAQVHATDENDD